MRVVTPDMRSLQCERSRTWVSLGLDGALSELESIRLERHLDGCPSCRAFATDAAAATHVLRSAPLEKPGTPVEIPGRIPARRRGAVMTIATAAAGFAAVLVLHPGSTGPESAATAAPVARPAGLAVISYDAANLGVRRRLRGSARVQIGNLVRGTFQLPTY